MPAGFGQRQPGDVVPVEVLVAVAPELEVMVQSVMPQLERGSVPEIARQQPERRVGPPREDVEDIDDSGQHAAVQFGERAGQLL